MTTLDKLAEAEESKDPVSHPFGAYEEEAIISLSLDHPQFFTAVCSFIKPAMFRRVESQWVIAEILNAFEEFNTIPTREILYDRITSKLTEDDPHEEVVRLIRRKSNPREIPMIKDTLLKWARDRQYGLLYSDEAIDAYRSGNYSYLEELVTNANRIADVSEGGFWFFENLELLFQPDIIDHRTTGFPKLDKLLNNGGPSKKEVVCWLAGTNVGKCCSLDTKIIEKRLSRVFELELEDGSILKLAGFREVQTARGKIRVCDLTDDLINEASTEDAKHIKSLKLVDGYEHVELRHIQDNPTSYSVLTPTGWSDIQAFQFTRRAKSKIIKAAGFELVCDPEHILMVDGSASLVLDIRSNFKMAIYAKHLDPSVHKLISYNGPVDFTVEDGAEEDFYDVQIEAPHWWYTSGVVSHNSILLCNNAISSLRGETNGGETGQDVLLITFELDSIKTAMRCLGAATGVPLDSVIERQDYIRRTVRTMERTYKKQFAIYEWPPDECSVNHIYALLDTLKRTKGWKPDVIILDYMDLMVSRVPEYNNNDYDRQKHVANEIRGLAKNENVLVFTATQTNRSGAMGDELADLNKVAESFAKQFSLDYVVSLNQSDSDRKAKPHPRIRFFVAKNRNGPKHEQVECEIEYDKMQVRELI